MNGKFTITIELGNDAMKSRRHVANALREVAKTILENEDPEKKIRDLNGNTVGKWEFIKE